MSPQWISYFGFGSLVNRDTRPRDEVAVNATLKGWGRVWNHRVRVGPGRQSCTSLSVEPLSGSIEGVVVRIPLSELPALDARESGYARMRLPVTDFVLPETLYTDTVYVYRSLQKNRHLADEQHPVAQSYIDCVMAGYLKRFGDDGLKDLLQTTRGWELPVLNDRQAPTYPRSVNLPTEQYQYFDTLLASIR